LIQRPLEGIALSLGEEGQQGICTTLAWVEVDQTHGKMHQLTSGNSPEP
jgi:hypothetical protein